MPTQASPVILSDIVSTTTEPITASVNTRRSHPSAPTIAAACTAVPITTCLTSTVRLGSTDDSAGQRQEVRDPEERPDHVADEQPLPVDVHALSFLSSRFAGLAAPSFAIRLAASITPRAFTYVSPAPDRMGTR